MTEPVTEAPRLAGERPAVAFRRRKSGKDCVSATSEKTERVRSTARGRAHGRGEPTPPCP
jgi:hypothetical protein